MTNHTSRLAAFGALVLGLVLTTVLHGSDTFLHSHHFTFNRPVAVPGAELAPGTYIFERVVASDPNLIVVRNSDRSKVHFLGFTERIERPRGVNDATVALGESRPGVPPPVIAWYPTGSTRGHRFIYR